MEDNCQSCNHEHAGPCECGCTVAMCASCNHMHGDNPCECGCEG